jgi:hypothetical protein
MVYAFECEPCQIRVYSASPKRARGCPLCDQPMPGTPVPDRGTRLEPQDRRDPVVLRQGAGLERDGLR